MPSKKQNFEAEEVKKYFEETTENSKVVWKCLIPKCMRVYKSAQVSVRKRHLEECHPIVMQEIVKSVTEKLTLADSDSEDETYIRVRISAKCVINACVEMVAKNGLPFSTMNGSGFLKILNPVLEGLGKSNKNISVNRNNIRNHLKDRADDAIQKIKRETSGRYVSIMMDIATRQSRSILGISAQYMLNDKIMIRTLAMDRLTSRNTAIALKDRVLSVLKKYDIAIDQIIAITTDNGSNMIKATELINDLNPTESSEKITNVLQLLDDTLATIVDDENENDAAENDFIDDDEINDILQPTEETIIEMKNTIEDIISGSSVLTFTNAVSCAAHTLQLGTGDAFNDESFAEGKALIQKCIKLVGTLRTKNVLAVIDREKFLRPVKHVPTRWNSVDNMVCIT